MGEPDLKADAEKILQMAPVRTGGESSQQAVSSAASTPPTQTQEAPATSQAVRKALKPTGAHTAPETKHGPDSHRQSLSSVATSAV